MKKIELTDKQYEVLSFIVDKLVSGDNGNHDYSSIIQPASPKSYEVLKNIDMKFKWAKRRNHIDK